MGRGSALGLAIAATIASGASFAAATPLSATSQMLRRRLLPPGIPSVVDVTVPCTNATTCGINGECRADVCRCDPGWSSPTLQAPCSAKGPAQLKLALLQYFFGWFGLPAFLLGWTALGIATVVCLVLMCGSYCAWAVAADALASARPATAYHAESVGATQQQKAQRKAKYERRQSCAACVGSVFCCAWFWLWIVISVYISLSSHCATSNGAPCKGWRRL